MAVDPGQARAFSTKIMGKVVAVEDNTRPPVAGEEEEYTLFLHPLRCA